jgi:hypothetical protein
MADDKKTTKGPQKAKAIVDTSIIGEDRVKALRLQAAKKVELERVKAAEAKMLEEFENEERQAGGIDEPMVDVYLDFAPYADRAMIDGIIYFAGQTKTVRESVALLLHEMMSATWKHQSEIDGKSENFYRRTRGTHVTANGGVSSNILRA